MAEDQLDRARRELAELEIQRARGDWLSTRAVGELFEDILVTFRNQVRKIPRTAMTALGLTHSQSRQLEKLLDQALEELARKLAKLADGNGPARAPRLGPIK